MAATQTPRTGTPRTGNRPADANPRVARNVAELRTRANRPIYDPFDANAPRGTVARRILAHNALIDVAVPGTDRICGIDVGPGPCVLREGHVFPRYDDDHPNHMDAEQRDRAERYLSHSDPNPDTRA